LDCLEEGLFVATGVLPSLVVEPNSDRLIYRGLAGDFGIGPNLVRAMAGTTTDLDLDVLDGLFHAAEFGCDFVLGSCGRLDAYYIPSKYYRLYSTNY